MVLTAALGWESEQTLIRKILARQSLPDCCLILADWLFGNPPLMREPAAMFEKSAGAMLFRVRSNLKATRVRLLSVGSWLVNIEVIQPGTCRKPGSLQLREIQVEIHDEGGEQLLAMQRVRESD